MDPGGDVDPVALRLLRDPLAVAGRAGVVDHGALSAALGAGLGDREESLALGVDACALAARAGPRRGAGFGAAAVAGGALARRRDGDRDLGAVHRLLEREPNLGLEIAAALLARPLLAAAEEGGEDVPEVGGEASTAGTREAAGKAAGSEAA